MLFPEAFDLRRITIDGYLNSLKYKSSLEKIRDMYKYLQEKHGARTIGQAMDIISQRKVDETAVQDWMKKGTYSDPLFYAFSKGYPEYRGLLQATRYVLIINSLGIDRFREIREE